VVIIKTGRPPLKRLVVTARQFDAQGFARWLSTLSAKLVQIGLGAASLLEVEAINPPNLVFLFDWSPKACGGLVALGLDILNLPCNLQLSKNWTGLKKAILTIVSSSGRLLSPIAKDALRHVSTSRHD